MTKRDYVAEIVAARARGRGHFLVAQMRMMSLVFRAKPSVDTSKPATRGRLKTGHHGVASETGGGLPRSHFLAQIGVDLGAPAAGSALEDVSVMQEAVE